MASGPYRGTNKEREARFEELLALIGGAGSPVPTSALRARREARGLSQHRLARVSGVSQPTISRVEAGTAELPADAAVRLDAALKTDVAGGEVPLYALEILTGLKRQALEGKLSPHKMLHAATLMAETEVTGEGMRPVIDAAVGAMLDVAVTAAEIWEGEAALKTRDRQGRKICKRFGGSKREDGIEGSQRDARGFRLNKPYGPKQDQGR